MRRSRGSPWAWATHCCRTQHPLLSVAMSRQLSATTFRICCQLEHKIIKCVVKRQIAIGVVRSNNAVKIKVSESSEVMIHSRVGWFKFFRQHFVFLWSVVYILGPCLVRQVAWDGLNLSQPLFTSYEIITKYKIRDAKFSYSILSLKPHRL